jgi:hypothetical protein
MESIVVKLFPSHIRPALNSAPSIALKNTLEGEKRSAIANNAKTKVPKINPNCTAEVRYQLQLQDQLITKSVTALLANQREVQQN